MHVRLLKRVLGAVAAAAVTTGAMAQSQQDQSQAGAEGEPKYGGELTIVVASEAPSWDGHIETTFGTIHPIAPFYSLLVRVDPNNPGDPTAIECDVCSSWETSDDGKTWTFHIRDDIQFHDGTKLTAQDVKATYDKIITPPEGIPSAYKEFYTMVDTVEAPDDKTVVFNLKYTSGAFLPALANPFNFIYAKKDLDEHGYEWHRTNVNGTGPFKFESYDPGASVTGVKNENYHHEGKPYLDRFKAIVATDMSARVQAIEGGQADIEFRGFPPKQRDDLVSALGDKITVQESDWNCVLIVTPNHEREPMSDPRVRKALTLALDRWGGSEQLSRIAIVKTVGGIVFPNHPLAATEEELTQLAGYSKDIEASREEAKRLLEEAGHPDGVDIIFNNRGVDQPYRVVGTWLVDQWRQVGIRAEQQVNPTPLFYDILRNTKEYDVSIDFNCQSLVNPLADVSFFSPESGSQHSGYDNPKAIELYEKLASAPTEEEQRQLMREYEKLILDEDVSQLITLWWYKINPYRSYVKGWKIPPSHYLAQQLDQIWLEGKES
jgi:peptide/nickel transport system substrate-binding protein